MYNIFIIPNIRNRAAQGPVGLLGATLRGMRRRLLPGKRSIIATKYRP